MAEHELNKIVDDSGEVFNLRDNTKVSLFDSTYTRNNASGDGWVKIAEVPDIVRDGTDVNAVWDVLAVTDGSALGVERIELSVRFINSSNPTPSLKVFNRYCLSRDTTASFSFAVKITGLAGSGNTTKVELWAWVKKGWYSLGIRESGAGSVSPYKTKFWTYFSYSSNGGSSKPVADASNNIQVADPMVVGENRTKLEDISKGANLVVNGCGTMCSNYNWPDFEWVGDYAVNSSAGSFKRSYAGNDNAARVCTEYIQVDPNKKVEISVDINVLSALVECDIRMTIFFYDIDKKLINAQSIMYGAGTLTELTQDLNPGDTVVHLSSVANWTTDIGQTYKRGFIFWDYQNSFGYTYPPETYSWNYYTNWFDSASDVDATTNTITLNKPWDGPKKLAGTKLSKCDSGGLYNYVSTKNVKTTELGQWFHLSGLVSGMATTGDNPVSKFRQGSAFIKVGFINGTANANYTYLFTNFRVYELPTRLSFARDIRVNLGSESAASFDGSADVSPGINGTLAIAHGGTGATTKKAAEYAINGGMAQGSGQPQDSFQFVFSRVGSDQSATNGVFLYRTAATIWSWIKGKISSVLGLSESNGVKTFTGNAATATKATQDSDGNAINATYFKSSGNTTLVSGAATKIGTQNGTDVKLTLPTIPSGTQLVYDCGTGSTSTTDFDNALAAFNAGNWVIIHSSGNTYHCVGTYNSGLRLRFKQIANETASIKVNTLNWTRGSAPSVGTQLEPSMPGHTHSQYVEKAGDTMSGNLTISKGANQGDTKFVASRTDTGTTGWFGIGDGGKNHGVYSESAYANTNNEVDNDAKGWVVRTDENGYSTLTGAVDGLFSKYFGNTETLRGMKRFRFGYSLDLEGDYTHVGATAIIEVRIYSAGVSGGSITMLFNASAQGDARSYYRLQVLSSNNWNLNSVCPVLIVQQASATAKRMHLGLVSGGPTSTTLMTFSYTEVKVLPLNGARKFNWSFDWDTNDFNSNTMTMIKPYVYPRAQIGTAVGDANTPLYVKNDGSFGTASGVDVAVALKDAGRGDVAGTSGHIVKVGYDNSSVPATTPSGNSTYAAGATVGTTKNLVTSYRYDGVAFYKDVDSGNVTVGNSLKWNGLNLVMSSTSTPAASTLYIF